MIISAEEIKTAQSNVAKHLQPTPLFFSRFYSALTGCRVYFKLEMLQPTHSFKVRGAFNAVMSMTPEQLQRGVFTASGGNHGLGVAIACATLNAPCTIYLPETSPKLKVDAIKKLGARTILLGRSWDEANAEAIAVSKDQNASYVHAFDNPLVMAGQGTIVTELLEQLKQLNQSADLIVASIGGGGLVSGIISATKHFTPQTRVAGVETMGANCMSESLAANKIVELSAITSICDSLGARKTAQRQFDIISNNISEVALVSDDDAIDTLLQLLAEEKLLVEPAASCSLAALVNKKIKTTGNETVVVVLCGGNIALDRVCQWQKDRAQTVNT